MKKAIIITIHVGNNFGSVLQTIATSKVLHEIGLNPLVLNYIPERVTYSYYWKQASTNIIKLMRRFFAFPIFIYNRYLYQGYLSRYVNLSNCIYTKDDLKNVCPKADFYITGSDQVWNSIHNQGLNTRYYYEGIEGAKIAYSSSFGVEKLELSEFNRVKDLLTDYKALSVREESGVKLIESMGLKATHLLDPTFMLSKDEWKEFMSERKIKENYVLLYIPYNILDSDIIYKSAYTIANKRKLKVVSFSWDFRSDKNVDKTVKFSNPGDFLSLIYYADFVITNSFHGTAFSINLNKQFWTFLPSGFSTRIRSILKLCALESRIVNKQLEIADLNKSIKYESVNITLNVEREKAIAFLKDALK